MTGEEACTKTGKRLIPRPSHLSPVSTYVDTDVIHMIKMDQVFPLRFCITASDQKLDGGNGLGMRLTEKLHTYSDRVSVMTVM